MFGFGRKKLTPTQQLERGHWRCGRCNEEHGWPFDLAAQAPDPWVHEREYRPNSALHLDADFLSEDFCVIEGKHFLVRAVLTIPVIGLRDEFGFGCWSTLSRANFEKYVAGFDAGEHGEQGPWSGWLCNQLAGFVEGSEPPAVWVQPRPNRLRPLLWIQDDDHPLAIAQEGGITPEEVLGIFTAYGHAPG